MSILLWQIVRLRHWYVGFKVIHLSASKVLICFWINFARMATWQASLPFSIVQSPRLVIDFMLLDQCVCCLALPGPYWMHPKWSRLCKAAGRIEQGSIRPNDLHMWNCSHCHCPANFSVRNAKASGHGLQQAACFHRAAWLSSLHYMMTWSTRWIIWWHDQQGSASADAPYSCKR